MQVSKSTKALHSPQLVLPFLKVRARNKINRQLVWHTDKMLFPPEIHLIVNNRCNYRCRTCDIGIWNVKHDTPLQDSPFFKNLHSEGSLITLDQFEKIAKEAAQHGSAVSFKGTEPTLTRNLDEYIALLTKYGLPSSITTNGYLLELFAEKFVKAGLKGIQVSIDGSPEINDMARGVPGGYEKSMAGIDKLHTVKQELKSVSPHIIINVTVSPFNYGRLVEALETFKAHPGINGVVFQHYNWISKELEEYHNRTYGTSYKAGVTCISEWSDPRTINVDILNKEIEIIKRKYRNGEYPFKIAFKPDFEPEDLEKYYKSETFMAKSHTFCHFMYQALTITSNGDIVPHMRCYDVKLGNIKDKSIMEIWNGEPYKKFRQELRKNDGALPGCAKCCGIFY